MRYKPRTDLERIFDAINKYSYGRSDKEIINKQLKNLALGEPEISELEDEIDTIEKPVNSDNGEEIKNNLMTDANLVQTHLSKRVKRKRVDNSDAKNLLKDYHNKTHFKATADISLFSRIFIVVY